MSIKIQRKFSLAPGERPAHPTLTFRASCIRARDLDPLTKSSHKIFVNPLTQTLDVSRMDKKFAGRGRWTIDSACEDSKRKDLSVRGSRAVFGDKIDGCYRREGRVTCKQENPTPETIASISLTLINLHIRQILPLVHGDDPSIVLSPTAYVNDEMLLAYELCQALKTIKREFAGWE